MSARTIVGTTILRFAGKERVLELSYKEKTIDITNKIKNLKFARKET